MVYLSMKPETLHIDSPNERDARWARQAKQDRTAFAQLYRQYARPMYRFVYARVSNTAEAEDLTAQIFMEALEKIEKYQEKGSFSGWIYTIARRRIIDHYRKKKPDMGFDSLIHQDSGADVWATVTHNIDLQRVASLFHQLTEEQQELLSLRFGADLSYKQIGEIIGKKESATKLSIHRLLQKLHTQWED